MHGFMRERQLDLFSGHGAWVETPPQAKAERAALQPASLDDDALAAAIPEASLNLAQALAAEAGRRRLLAAVPALERLCWRLAGFGLDRKMPEQVAALEALAQIGGAEAAKAVLRILCKDAVQGPAVADTMAAAARLGIVLPEGKAVPLLRHPDPLVRADACRCAPFRPAAVAVLAELLDDLNTAVAAAAACALGRMGQAEARPVLFRLLRQAPTVEIVEAISEVACDEAIVLLGRIARSDGPLAGQAFETLAGIDHPRALRLVEVLAARRRQCG